MKIMYQILLINVKKFIWISTDSESNGLLHILFIFFNLMRPNVLQKSTRKTNVLKICAFSFMIPKVQCWKFVSNNARSMKIFQWKIFLVNQNKNEQTGEIYRFLSWKILLSLKRGYISRKSLSVELDNGNFAFWNFSIK